ncbi:hypothetical protein JQ625_18605 [Bradyrhizobium diazoefficiens]|nr:hypothetical protein [Bradyrhizobium diazoefficiens]MBR0776851.1 hypothetical protein [Bradyrhizobium diazoefficiens]
MSYLNALRLHFAGQFQANVSTVNNDPAHFHNRTFKSSYQDMQGTQPNGWFNPQGDAAFRLLGCKVTSASMPSGPVASGDAVLQCLVMDSDSRAPAKLVDLDSEQQLVSEIWGLQVRITDNQGQTLLSGDFEPMAFIDIWFRAQSAPPGSDTPAGAMWQSVLRSLKWGDIGHSQFLKALKKEADASGTLSIKFNLDGINMDFTSPDFMCGRIVGTIGPASIGEPAHLVIGRQFMAANTPGNQSFFQPQNGLNFCVARIDPTAKCVFLDLGNALPTDTPGSGVANLGDLVLSAAGPTGAAVPLGTIPASGAGGYTAGNWYETTAGIVVLPLSDSQLQATSAHPLTISGNAQTRISEWKSGAFVRADTYVYRMSPGETASIAVYAMQWGKALANATVSFQLDPSQLQPTQVGPGQPYVENGPPVATPKDILKVGHDPISSKHPTVVTDAHGKAILKVTAGDPKKARWFGADFGIDGQVYGLRPAFAEASLNSGPVNDGNFVSFLVWSGFSAGTPVTWHDLAPVFQQYANLYPVMNRFLDLGNYDSVVENAGFLSLAFGLNLEDPNAMPVTRDLSPAKRKAILSWLADPAHPKGQAVAAVAAAPSPATPQPQVAAAMHGGKAAAMSRRLVLQSP